MRNLLPRNDGQRALLPRLVFLVVVVLVVGAREATASSSSSSKIVELTTATFEHQTQASTGQTTGKWFVKFVARGVVIVNGWHRTGNNWRCGKMRPYS